MKPDVGILIRTFEAGGVPPPLPWAGIRPLIEATEQFGFHSVSFPDHLLWRLEDRTMGFRECFTLTAAAAAVTTTIEIGTSVVNGPFRNPGLVAKMATTLDEISDGRFVLGIGAGGGPPSDYETFGYPLDHRYSRFEEAIAIIHGLLRDGEVDFAGRFSSAPAAQLIPRGPSDRGPRIVLAAKGPKMLRLAARYADEWNWYSIRDSPTPEHFSPMLEALEQACDAEGRDPASMRRSLDITAAPTGRLDLVQPSGVAVLHGSRDEMADWIGRLGAIGIDEIRMGLIPDDVEEIEALADVVSHL